MNTTLIKELETADQGSRELSNYVLTALGWTCISARPVGDVMTALEAQQWRSPDRKPYTEKEIPDPTQSVDDALSLVPEGWGLTLENWSGLDTEGRVFVDGRGHVELCPAVGGGVEASAATLPLAICIAILKAREASDGE
jgi:hypothetical protein